MKRRYHCMACRCDEVEISVDADGDRRETVFVCFNCQHLFFFMRDAAPRTHELSVFELYQHE